MLNESPTPVDTPAPVKTRKPRVKKVDLLEVKVEESIKIIKPKKVKADRTPEEIQMAKDKMSVVRAARVKK